MSEDELREAVLSVVASATRCLDCEGTGRSLQGWTDKNGYPEDQFGPCFACGKVADALLPLLRERERLAWSLGQLSGLDDYERNDGTLTPNPYRAASDQPSPPSGDLRTARDWIVVGAIWRRKKTGALLRITRAIDSTSEWNPATYYDIHWETVEKPRRRGVSYEDYWLRNCEPVGGES